MLNKEIEDILRASKEDGWIMEPQSKRLLSVAGMEVPKFICTNDVKEALSFANEIGYPVVAKIVSPKVLHKSDVGGVVADINDDMNIKEVFLRYSHFDGFVGMLVEEMVDGVELIVGAKIDYQFGPVILLGIGGTGVEIYRDTALRMAPLNERDVESMLGSLKARQLLEGYRGSDPINLQELSHTMIAFSSLVMELEHHVESIDLNPVICSSDRCVVADARIILATNNP